MQPISEAARFALTAPPAASYWPAPTQLPASMSGCNRAQMAELVDAPASGAGARKGVEVRVLFWAPTHSKQTQNRLKHGLRIVFATVYCYGLVPRIQD